jgi:hypothetical protein
MDLEKIKTMNDCAREGQKQFHRPTNYRARVEAGSKPPS